MSARKQKLMPANDLEYFHKLEQIKATRIGRVADRPPHRR